MRSQKPFFENKKKLIFGHRGFSGKFPENTMVSFQSALDAGANVLELDVHLTKDNQLVVIHDSTVNRTTNGFGKVSQFSVGDLKKFNAGFKFITIENGKTKFPFRSSEVTIPTLTELFLKFPYSKFNIDLKQHDKKTCETLLNLILDLKMEDKVLVASDHFETINYFRKISAGKTATGASYREILNFIIFKNKNKSKWFPFGADALQIPEKYFGMRILTQNLIRVAHQNNIMVHAWVINKKQDILRLLNWDVDGIMTDNPDLWSKTFNEI